MLKYIFQCEQLYTYALQIVHMEDIPTRKVRFALMHSSSVSNCSHMPCRLSTWKTSLQGNPSMPCPPPPCQSQCKPPSKYETSPRCSPTRRRPSTPFWLAGMWWCLLPQPVASPCATTFLSWRPWCRIEERVLFICSPPRCPLASDLQTTSLE